MANALITFTTDFGLRSPYVASMKGIVLGVHPDVTLVDLSHHIPPQDVRHAAFFLASALVCFPANALHVVVVDPGVGTERDVLYVEVGEQRILAPDNGCWTWVAPDETPSRVIRLTQPEFWRTHVSYTFHGRDIFAPVAGHLARGVEPSELGESTDTWTQLPFPEPTSQTNFVEGEILYIDDFGNLISNISAENLPSGSTSDVVVELGNREVSQCVRTYGEAEPGSLVSLISSFGMLEVAVVAGSAATLIGVEVGTPIRVSWNTK